MTAGLRKEQMVSFARAWKATRRLVKLNASLLERAASPPPPSHAARPLPGAHLPHHMHRRLVCFVCIIDSNPPQRTAGCKHSLRHAYQHAHCQVRTCLVRCTGWLVCLVCLVDTPSDLPQQTWHTRCHGLHHALCQVRMCHLTCTNLCMHHTQECCRAGQEAMNSYPGSSSFPGLLQTTKKLVAAPPSGPWAPTKIPLMWSSMLRRGQRTQESCRVGQGGHGLH